MRALRIVCLVAVVALVGGCASATAPSRSAAPSGDGGSSPAGSAGPRTSPPPGGPAATARAVLDATSDDAREAAILDVFAAVGIGVYMPDGTPLRVGAERGPNDFFAYDFEIEALALALRDGDRVLLSDIAVGIGTLGLLGPTADDPAAIVGAALDTAVDGALAEPDDPSSYALLVARELSLGADEPVDLVSPAGDDVALDPLAGFLVAADLVLPSIAATSPDAIAALRRTANAADAAAGVPFAAGPCPTQIQGQGGWRAGRTAGQLPNGGASNPASLAYLQLLLANSIVQVAKQALPGGGLNWHYRHDPADTEPRGYELVFSLRINPSPGAILCGVMSGTTLPQDRKLGGVPVLWEYEPFRAHGTADCPAAGCAATDRQGASTFKFLPKAEQVPVGIGPELEASGAIRARWDVGRSLAPELAAVIQGATSSSYGWLGKVAYHRPYDVFIDLTSDIRIIEALSLIGHVADAHADGRIDGQFVHAPGAAPVRPPCGQPICAGPVLALDTLNVKTTAATDGPKCNVPHVTIDGPASTIEIAVIDAVIYPAASMTLRLDMGFNQERIDVITYVPCKGPTQVSPPGVSAWEHYMLRYRGSTGFLFEGLKAGTADGPGWVYVADAATWEHGGTVAIWDAPEGCGGSCDPARSRIRLELKVVPLPLP